MIIAYLSPNASAVPGIKPLGRPIDYLSDVQRLLLLSRACDAQAAV